MKLADDPKYTQEEFDKLIEDYSKDKRGDIPQAASYDEMFNTRLDARQAELDRANKSVAKAVSRANGISPWLVGGGALIGAGAGGALADLFIGGWHKPTEKDFSDPVTYKQKLEEWKRGRWKRLLGHLALRAGGFMLGGAIPYLGSRAVEGALDGGSAILSGAGKAIASGYNKLTGGKK